MLNIKIGQYYSVEYIDVQSLVKSRRVVEIQDCCSIVAIKHYIVKIDGQWWTRSQFEAMNPQLIKTKEILHAHREGQIVCITDNNCRVETIIERVSEDFVSHTLRIETVKRFNERDPIVIGEILKFFKVFKIRHYRHQNKIKHDANR